MSSSGMRVPVGLPGEHRNVSLIGRSLRAASDSVRLICEGASASGVGSGRGRGQRTHLVDARAERAALELEVDLDDVDVVDLGADAVHAVGGRAHEDAVAAGDARDAEQEVDDLVGPDAEEEVVGRGDVAEGAQALLDVVVGRGGVAVEVEVVE